MAKIVPVIPPKSGLTLSDHLRCLEFAEGLRKAMTHGSQQTSILLSNVPTEHIGTQAAPRQAPGTSSAIQVVQTASHSPWATHRAADFITSNPTVPFARAHVGYSMETEAQYYFEKQFGTAFKKGPTEDGSDFDYLYNDPKRYASNGFPTNFEGTGSGGARPDWRLKLLQSPGEAIFDATSEAQLGHLIKKRVGSLRLHNVPTVLYGAEIIYETSDSYFDTSTVSARTRLCFLAFSVLAGVVAAAVYLAGYMPGQHSK